MGKISCNCLDMHGASPDEKKMRSENLTSSLIGLCCQSLRLGPFHGVVLKRTKMSAERADYFSILNKQYLLPLLSMLRRLCC